jgi:hypothetical protein
MGLALILALALGGCDSGHSKKLGGGSGSGSPLAVGEPTPTPWFMPKR